MGKVTSFQKIFFCLAFWKTLNWWVGIAAERASLVAQWERIHLQCRRHGFDPWVIKTPWKRAWQLTAVFLQWKSHGPRRLADYSPWGRKESDTTEATEHAHTHSCWSVSLRQSSYNTSQVIQLCSTLCDPMDCSLSHSSVHGIFQARILEWVAISFSNYNTNLCRIN